MEMQLNPGPIVTDVLHRQHLHRSTDVWNRAEYTNDVIQHRMHLRKFGRGLIVDPRVLHYIKLAGFYCIYRLGSTFELDNELVTTLVERWRPETHTFHLNVGEATITLQDVSVLLGLRVDGLAVTGTACHSWPTVAQMLLGVTPPADCIRGSSVKVSWLRQLLVPLPDDADDVAIQCQARAYILLLMAGVTFADTSGGQVQLIYLPLLADLEATGQYSWGSATLAFLYRQLCRATHQEKAEIVGPIILLQLWAWERIPIGRPRCIYVNTGGDERELRKAKRQEFRKKKGQGSQPPPFGVHFEDGEDSLAMRWLHCSYSYGTTPKTLKYYRDALDRQREDQFVWEPYTSDVLARLASICQHGGNIWRTTTPLICFEIVEWHHPERVMRQFGDVQLVPGGCHYDEALHKMDRRGKHQHNWAQVHEDKIKLWNEREDSIQVALQVDDVAQATAQYMTWYARITRRLISPPMSSPAGVYQPVAPDFHMMGNFVMDVSQRATQTSQAVHQFYEHHQYNSMMESVDGYCTYTATQDPQLLGQVSFNPAQPHVPTTGWQQHPSTAEMPTSAMPPSGSGYLASSMPPSGSGYASQLGIPTASSMIFPSYPSYGSVGTTPSRIHYEFGQPRCTFPQATFAMVGPTSMYGDSQPILTTSPLVDGRIMYDESCNIYGGTPPARQRATCNMDTIGESDDGEEDD